MAVRLGALHDALLHPGDAEMAKKAAEEVAEYQTRMASIDTKLSVLMWIVTTLVALEVGTLWLSMNILSRLPR